MSLLSNLGTNIGGKLKVLTNLVNTKLSLSGGDITGKVKITRNTTIGANTPENGALVVSDGVNVLGIDSNEIISSLAVNIGSTHIDGGVNLKYGTANKFSTTVTGATVTGSLKATDSISAEGGTIIIGDGFGTGGASTIHKLNNDLYLQYNNGLAATNLRLGGGNSNTKVNLQTTLDGTNYTTVLDTTGMLYEAGTALSNKYLGLTAKAADADLLDGLNASSTSAVNTIVSRDANADSSFRVLNVSNEVRVGSGGSDADPAFTFVGDQSTGIYNPAANQMKLVTGGATTCLLSTGGLTVYGDNGIFIKTKSNGGGAELKFSDQTDAIQFGTMEYHHSDGAIEAGYTDAFLISGSEPTTLVKVDGDIKSTGSTIASRITVANAGAATSVLHVDSGGHANIQIDRKSTAYDNNLLFYTGGVLNWRLWQSGAENVLAIRNEVTDKNVLTFTDNDAAFVGDVHLSTGNLTRGSHNNGHLEGSYNSVGQNSLYSNPIYTIGSSYNPDASTLGLMYGTGYTSCAATFLNATDLGVDPGTNPSVWGQYIASDGNARIFLESNAGHGYFKGNLHAQDAVVRGSVKADNVVIDDTAVAGKWTIQQNPTTGDLEFIYA